MSIPLTVLEEACGSVRVDDALAPQTADTLAQTFKALADPVRLRLLSLISAHVGAEACVCDLNEAFDLSQPTISHHLKVLREAGLVRSERRGSWMYYAVESEAVDALLGAFGAALGGIR